MPSHAHGFMRFANGIIGAVAASLKGVGIIHCTLRFARIKKPLVSTALWGKTCPPKEANRVAFRDGHRGQRRFVLSTMMTTVSFIGLWVDIPLQPPASSTTDSSLQGFACSK